MSIFKVGLIVTLVCLALYWFGVAVGVAAFVGGIAAVVTALAAAFEPADRPFWSRTA